MVTQATINAKIGYGFNKAAKVLGASCAWYRPSGAGNPLATQFGTIQAAFRQPNTGYMTPSTYSKPLWWGLFDLTTVDPGDYIVEPNMGTFFVASVDAIRNPLCIACNQTITITRPGNQTPGSTYYGGVWTESTVMTSWPASVLQGTKGEKGEVSLPGDVRLSWVQILVPYAGVELLPGDVVTTAETIPMAYTISSRELTNLGWRLSAALATA